MNKSFLSLALGVLFTASAFSSAHADERFPRWYLGLTGGVTYMSDQDVSGTTLASKTSLNTGYGYGGSVGYLPSSASPLINALRFEAEITHHTNDIDKVSIRGVGKINGSGNYSSTAYMANVFYDFPTSSAWAPYIGAGVGMASLHLSTGSGVGNTDDSSNEFAYQGLAGIGYSPSSIPNTQWTLGYRYLATSQASFGTPTGDAKVDYSSHSLEAGVKLRF